jgi:hypothetical protein
LESEIEIVKRKKVEKNCRQGMREVRVQELTGRHGDGDEALHTKPYTCVEVRVGRWSFIRVWGLGRE